MARRPHRGRTADAVGVFDAVKFDCLAGVYRTKQSTPPPRPDDFTEAGEGGGDALSYIQRHH